MSVILGFGQLQLAIGPPSSLQPGRCHSIYITGVQETTAPVRTIGHFLCIFQRNDYLGVSQAKLTLVQLQGCDNHALKSGILSTAPNPPSLQSLTIVSVFQTRFVNMRNQTGTPWPCAGVFGVTFAIRRIRSWSTRQSMVKLQRPGHLIPLSSGTSVLVLVTSTQVAADRQDSHYVCKMHSGCFPWYDCLHVRACRG